jgi:hypothetical protein
MRGVAAAPNHSLPSQLCTRRANPSAGAVPSHRCEASNSASLVCGCMPRHPTPRPPPRLLDPTCTSRMHQTAPPAAAPAAGPQAAQPGRRKCTAPPRRPGAGHCRRGPAKASPGHASEIAEVGIDASAAGRVGGTARAPTPRVVNLHLPASGQQEAKPAWDA